MLTKKKKVFMLAGMVLLLAVTVWLNIMLSAEAKDGNPDEDVLAGNFMATFRAVRQTTRNEEISWLDTIIATTAEEYKEDRAEAMEQKKKLIAAMEMEHNIEYQIKAKGYEDVGVTIDIFTDKVSVLVKKADLSVEDTAIIYDALREHGQIDANNVSITPILE